MVAPCESREIEDGRGYTIHAAAGRSEIAGSAVERVGARLLTDHRSVVVITGVNPGRRCVLGKRWRERQRNEADQGDSDCRLPD